MDLRLPSVGALLTAALSGAALARRVREHWPVALALVALAARSLVRAALNATILFPLGPYTGPSRVAFHVDQALYLLSPAALAWLALVVLLESPHAKVARSLVGEAGDGRTTGQVGLEPSRGRSRGLRFWGVTATWLTLSAVCAFCYPALRGDALARVYLGAELVALAVALLAIAAWLRRGGWRALDVTSGSVLAIVLTSAAMLVAGPWRAGLFGVAWRLEQAGLLALYPVLTAMQLWAWWKARVP